MPPGYRQRLGFALLLNCHEILCHLLYRACRDSHGCYAIVAAPSRKFRSLPVVARPPQAGTPLIGSIRSGDAAIHFRSYGQGQPVLLLHGGLSHRLSWFSQVPWLVDSGRQVILLEIRGHGESGLGDAELSYRLLAADAINVLDALGIERTDVIGWSDGANTALLLAHLWPKRVGRIVAISGNVDPSGLTPEAHTDNHTQDSGLAYWYKRWWTGAGERFSELEKRIKKLWRTGPNLQSDDLRAIETPTLVIIGENDVVTLDHARQMSSACSPMAACQSFRAVGTRP